MIIALGGASKRDPNSDPNHNPSLKPQPQTARLLVSYLSTLRRSNGLLNSYRRAGLHFDTIEPHWRHRRFIQMFLFWKCSAERMKRELESLIVKKSQNMDILFRTSLSRWRSHSRYEMDRMRVSWCGAKHYLKGRVLSWKRFSRLEVSTRPVCLFVFVKSLSTFNVMSLI